MSKEPDEFLLRVFTSTRGGVARPGSILSLPCTQIGGSLTLEFLMRQRHERRILVPTA